MVRIKGGQVASWLQIGWLLLATPLPLAAESTVAEETAAGCIVPSQLAATRPDPEGTPTPITVTFHIIDIKEIDDVHQTFFVDFMLTLRWQDTRLVDVIRKSRLAECWLDLHMVWHPQVHIVNESALRRHFAENVTVDAAGTAKYLQRLSGYLSSPFDFRAFPFDTQALPISLISIRYGPSKVVFIFDDEGTTRRDRFSIAGWSIGPATEREFAVRGASYAHLGATQAHTRLDYTYSAQRQTNYFLWKIVAPMVIIVFMSWTVFWIDPTQLGTQVSISTASMLTLIAFLITLGRSLPPVPYLTRLDHLVLGSLVLVFFALVEAIGTGTLVIRGRETLARRLDQWSRGVFPIVYMGLAFFAFWS